MSILRSSVVAVTCLLALAGCKKSEGGKANLPPASGPNAPALPDIPTITAPSEGGAPINASDARTTGTLVAPAEVAVAAKASGVLTEITVDEGDKVKKGDVLFRQDARDAQLRRAQAATQLRGAELQVKTLQIEYERSKSLFEQNALPRQQWDQIQAQVESAQVSIAAAKNSLAMADKAIADTVVRAPSDGVVLTRRMNVGEYATVMPPSTVVVLQDQRTLELRFRMAERSLASIHAGDTISVELPSLGITKAAIIARVSPTVDVRTRTIELVTLLDNADGALRPGMMAQVALTGLAPPKAETPAKAETPPVEATTPKAPPQARPGATPAPAKPAPARPAPEAAAKPAAGGTP